MEKVFKELCTPAKIYFVLAVISVLLGFLRGIPIPLVISKLIVAIIWTYFLGWICKKGYKNVSWFLVLAPFIMIFLITLGLMREVNMVNHMNPMTPPTVASATNAVASVTK